jgi:glycosyltransferase involved in cell wall biosynthesis
MSSAATAYGGSETYILNVAKNLIEDFNVKLIVGRGNFTNDFRTLVDNNPVNFLSVPFISRNSKFSALLRKTKLYNKINDFDFEALTTIASIVKITKFISDSDILEVQYPTESLIFPFIKKRIKKIIHFHGPWPPPLYTHTKNLINGYADAFITCSAWSKNVLEQKYNIKNIKVIYNGVDNNFFKSDNAEDFKIQQKFNRDLPRFGTVGRLSKEKGTDLLFKAALELEGTAEFFAVGPCEESLFQEIKNSSISNFHLLGSLPNNALPAFYNFIDCFVLPSLFEAFGITLIEAMSCGKPVIASNIGGIPEIIDSENNGILVEAGNYILFKEAIVRMINDKNMRLNFGQSARQKVVENFTIERTYRELKDFYANLIG